MALRGDLHHLMEEKLRLQKMTFGARNRGSSFDQKNTFLRTSLQA